MIEALHRFVGVLASRDFATSKSIGPLSITSRFLPIQVHVEDGLSSETARPLMVDARSHRVRSVAMQ